MYLATKTCSRQDPALLLDGPNGLGTPITDLCVITGKSKDIQAPVGYTKVEGDLNQGTGGSCVFLCAKRSLTESRRLFLGLSPVRLDSVCVFSLFR